MDYMIVGTCMNSTKLNDIQRKNVKQFAREHENVWMFTTVFYWPDHKGVRVSIELFDYEDGIRSNLSALGDEEIIRKSEDEIVTRAIGISSGEEYYVYRRVTKMK